MDTKTTYYVVEGCTRRTVGTWDTFKLTFKTKSPEMARKLAINQLRASMYPPYFKKRNYTIDRIELLPSWIKPTNVFNEYKDLYANLKV